MSAMKIWCLLPIEPCPWDWLIDAEHGFVVRAGTEADARALAAKDAGEETLHEAGNPWLQEEYTTCKELLPEGTPEVLLMGHYPN